MASSNGFLTTPTKTTLSDKKSSSFASRNHYKSHRKLQMHRLSFKARFEAYNCLQAAAVAFGEKLPIPEIVVIGGQSDGKRSLLEALLGFKFNVREVEMGTRRCDSFKITKIRFTAWRCDSLGAAWYHAQRHVENMISVD